MELSNAPTFFEKYAKPIFIVGTLGAGAALVYALCSYGRGGKQNYDHQLIGSGEPFPLKIRPALNRLKETLRKKIEEGGELEISHVTAIQTLTDEIVALEIIEVCLDAREQRRKEKNHDLDLYSKIVMESGERCTQLFQNARAVLLDFLGVTIDLYNKSIQHHFRFTEGFAMYSIGQRESIKTKMPVTRSMNYFDAREYLNSVIETIQNTDVSQIKEQEPGMQSFVLRALVNDKLFELLGFEEEDFIRLFYQDLESISQDPILMKLIKEKNDLLAASDKIYGSPAYLIGT